MALREILAKFSIEVEDGKLKSAGGAVDAMAGKLAGLATLVGGAALVGGFRSMVGEIVDLGGSLTDTSAKLGVGTGDLQRWQFAAQQTGVEAGAFSGALTKFTRTIGEAATGNAAAGDAFKALGVDVRDSNGNIGDATTLMLGAAKGLSEIQDPSLRAKAAIDLFGKSGADLLPLLGQGAEGVQALLDEADKLGGVLDESTIEALDDAGDASDKFDFAMRGVKAQLALAVLPALTAAGGKLAELVGKFTSGEEGAQHLKAALATLGAIAFATGVRAALPWIGWALVIAGLVLIVDDLWTGLQGGDSVTGRFLDRMFGKGSGASIFKAIRDDATALWARMREAGGVAGAVEEAFSTVGSSIVSFFVDDIPAALDVVKQRVADGTASTGEKIVQGIRDAVSGLGPVLLDAGMDAAAKFIAGIVDGIKAGVGAVSEAVQEMAKASIASLATGLDSRSPSRKTHALGEHGFAAGAAEGIRKGRAGVEREALALADGSVRALAPMGAGASSGARSLVQTNHVSVAVQGTGAGAVRTGLASGLGDVGRSAMAYLESGTG